MFLVKLKSKSTEKAVENQSISNTSFLTSFTPLTERPINNKNFREACGLICVI